MYIFLAAAIVGLSTSCATVQPQGQPLYSYRGEPVYRNSLDQTSQQKLFQLEKQAYDARLDMIRESVINRYLTDLAQQQNKSVDTLRGEIFSNAPVTDAERKAFLQEHATEISAEEAALYPELDQEVVNDRQLKAKQKLLKDAELAANITLFSPKPQTPEARGVNQFAVAFAGAPDAKVEIVEFADFTCPHCANVADKVRAIKKRYGNKIKLSYRHFLLNPKGYSTKVAIASECAAKQDKFWQFYDYVFANQYAAITATPDELANKLALNADKYKSCLNDSSVKNMVSIRHQHAAMLGVKSTPTFFVNSRQISVGENTQELENAIEQELR